MHCYLAPAVSPAFASPLSSLPLYFVHPDNRKPAVWIDGCDGRQRLFMECFHFHTPYVARGLLGSGFRAFKRRKSPTVHQKHGPPARWVALTDTVDEQTLVSGAVVDPSQIMEEESPAVPVIGPEPDYFCLFRFPCV